MKTVNALYTGKCLLSNRFQKIIYPQIRQSMPLICRRMIPLSELFDDSHIDVVEYDDSVYSLDFRHWYYSDDVFARYVEKIAELKPSFLFVFDNPYDYERPWKIDFKTFSRKLSQRTVKLVDAVRKESPETQFIAPVVSVIHHAFKDVYLDFLTRHKDYFDIYSVLCANDMTDISIGAVSSQLVELISGFKKPTWILCAIPCGDKYKSELIRDVDDTGFKPLSERDATFKLKQLFDLFRNITDDLRFFYFGIDRDAFDPFRGPKPSDFWVSNLPLDLYIYEYKWNWFHYLGLLDYTDRVKAHLFKGLLDLAKKYNV